MPDFSIKPEASSAINTYKNSTTSKVKKAYADFMGVNSFIGETNVFEILNCAEELETNTEYGYAQQKGIGQKPILVYTGEGLKQYSLPIKLHHSYCRPDYILEELKLKAKEHDAFSYFQGEKYIGEYVIINIAEKLINTYQGVTLYAEITVDILECPDMEDEEFQQQTKAEVEIPNDAQTVNGNLPKTPVEAAKDTGKDVFNKLTEKAVDTALRSANSYLSGTIGGVTGGIL